MQKMPLLLSICHTQICEKAMKNSAMKYNPPQSSSRIVMCKGLIHCERQICHCQIEKLQEAFNCVSRPRILGILSNGPKVFFLGDLFLSTLA